jgi:CBS domain-containing protein
VAHRLKIASSLQESGYCATIQYLPDYSQAIGVDNFPSPRSRLVMKVSHILRVKGNALYTMSPEQTLSEAMATMANFDIGSLLVMDHGDLVGILTFREAIAAVVRDGNSAGARLIRTVMDDAPLTCTPETEIDEVRRMMLEHHVRYMPVMSNRLLMGVISFYDVAKAVVDGQNFENRLLKA